MLYKWETIGHQKQLEQLEEDIQNDNISHAYLFDGPEGIGMFHIAKMFANILQCPNDFCRKCEVCRAILHNTHSDTILIQDDGEIIKIDDIRELIRKTNLTTQSNYRIFVIENIERMPIVSQNSFLKTLEEPPGKTMFILTTTQINQVLPTIRSRVRHFPFFNVDNRLLQKGLEEKFGKDEQLDEVLNIAQGRPGFAINLMQTPVLLRQQRDLYNQIDLLLSTNNIPQKFLFIEQLDEDKEQLNLFFDAFSRYLRKLLFDFLSKPDHPLKSRFSFQDLVKLFESFEETRYLIKRNVNKKLALENFFLQMERN